MAYTKGRRSQVQFTRVFGWKVSKTVYKGVKSGRYTLDTLFKHLEKHNEGKLKKITFDPKKLFEKARTFGDGSFGDVWDYLRQLASVKSVSGGGSWFQHNMPHLIEETLSADDKIALMADLNVDEDTLMWEFNNWTWNSSLNRLESPDGKHWITYTKKGSEYQMNELNWGNL